MRTVIRITCVALAIMILLAMLSGCKKSVDMQQDESLRYISFRDVPGITDDEIKAIERLQKQVGSFIFGTADQATEAFYEGDGRIRGCAALFCDWLTELFGIPFIPAIYEWADLVAGLETGEVHFTGELTANNELRKTYFMTDAIAERVVKYMRIVDSEPFFKIAESRPLKYAFLIGTTTIDEISPLIKDNYEVVQIDSYNIAYNMLVNGEIDAFFYEGSAGAAFGLYSGVVIEEFYPLIYSPVALSTQNPELQAIISIVQKFLQSGGIRYLTELYNLGYHEYKKHKLFMQLSEEELAYIHAHPVVSFAAEYDNYPISFYNTHDKKWQGIVFDVLNDVERLTGLKFELVNSPYTEWPILLKMLESGETSIVSKLIHSKDREGRFIWPKTAFLTDHPALLSKLDYRNININEISYVKVGLAKDSAHTELFRRWFPSHVNTIEYDSIDNAFKALEHGDIDMVMATESLLLTLTNYKELPGYKANVVFSSSYNTTLGFNKDETVLCSIVDKALNLIDTNGISGQWLHKTYNYQAKLVQAQHPWLISVSALLLCILILLFALFRRTRHEGRQLEDVVHNRTAELEKQYMLMYIVNDAATLLLESDAEDYLSAMNRGMEMIGRGMDVDRMYVWQHTIKNDGKLYYKQVVKWASEGMEQDDSMFDFSYHDTLPRWEHLLSRGEIVNGQINSLPVQEQLVLIPYQIKSILVIPIFLNDKFWGFVSFDDCHKQRVFLEGEVNVLRSWGLLIVGAIQRGKIAQDMRDTLTKLKAVTSNYKGIIWSVNNDGVITTFSGHYLKTLGIEPHIIEGKKLEAVQLKNKYLNIIGNVENTLRKGPQDWMVEIDDAMFHSYTTPIYDGEGRIVGVVGSTDDVTETVKLQQDLKDASKAKSIFLANMSHEIRTPMNAIIGMTAIGKSTADIERKNYSLKKIEDASKHLLGVINDILDMSKIEAGKFELSSVDFNFETMLQQVVNVINFRIEEKQQKFILHIDRKIPEILIGDAQRLTQVITNLLGNAVKFTPTGGAISLNTHFLGEKNDVCIIKIEVIDTGIGLSPEQQARLFQSFAQAEASTARKFGGTGLGLSISKNIVEMMGGKIWVESEINKGSTFAFTIQMKLDTARKQLLSDHDMNWKNIRIMAVDDDPDVLSFFEEIMRDYDASFDTAICGEDAIRLVEQNGVYNIYFIDWKIPDIDGIELIKRLKEIAPAQNDTVVIMISATEWSIIAEDAKQAGIDKFLSKPLFPSTIIDIINDIIGINHKNIQETSPHFDGIFAGYRILLAEDIEINCEIVLALLEPTLLEIDWAKNGLEAVRMFSEAPKKYDMILMDLQMPEMDGYEATRYIRAFNDPKSKTIPILAMTANVFREDIEKCLEAGMDNHIGKPLDFDEVLEKLRVYLPQRSEDSVIQT